MLANRGSRLAYRHVHNGKGRPAQSASGTRSYSQILSRPAAARPSPWQTNRASGAHLAALSLAQPQGRRLASTGPAPAAAAAAANTATSASPAAASAAVSTPPPPASPLEAVTSAEWDAMLQAKSAAAYPVAEGYIGWLRDLGLDFGWGPTSMMQTLVELLYVSGGLPWWGAIAAATFAIRGGAIPLYIRSSDTSARLASLRPVTGDLQKQMQEARAAGDNTKMMQLTTELRQMHRAAGVKPSRIFWPLLVQAPLGFGLFRLVRNMAQLPVPGLETGGILWFTDLTAGDPYFILPVLGAAAQYLSLKRGGEMGAQADPSQQRMMRILTNVMPGFLFVISATMPSAVQLLLVYTATYGLMQGISFRSPGFRRMAGIYPLPKAPEEAKKKINTYLTPDEAAKKNSVTSSVTGVLDRAKNIMAQRNSSSGGTKRLGKAELEKAKEYEKARRAEIEAAREQYFKQRRNK